MSKKSRLDLLVVERGLAPSRAVAQSLIMRGDVLVDDVPFLKPGVLVLEDRVVSLRGDPPRFVGRGGDKIFPVFELFNIDLDGRIVIDVGASTGGFTDVALQRGAKLVYAVDVGSNQLAYRLRIDPRVRVMEQTHAKELRAEQFSPTPDFAMIDVSFIGVRKILDPVLHLLASPFELLVLVKPQFELGPDFVEKGGVVRDAAHQLEAVNLVRNFLESRGHAIAGSAPAALTGAKKGNQEYFLYARGKRD